MIRHAAALVAGVGLATSGLAPTAPAMLTVAICGSHERIVLPLSDPAKRSPRRPADSACHAGSACRFGERGCVGRTSSD